jgi:glucosamine-6-phosphate deaminase
VRREVFASEEAVADALAGRLIDAVRRRPALVLGLPTGRTPLALYLRLIAETAAAAVDWSGVRTFNLDEFVGLGAGDPGSYRTFMQTRFFDHVNIDPRKIGFLDGHAADPEAECARYEGAIAAAGGLDIVVLGIGANGHIGFNEPAEALVARTHRAVLDEPTRAANALWFEGELGSARGADHGHGDTAGRTNDRAGGDGGGEGRCRGRGDRRWHYDARASLVPPAAPARDGDARRRGGERNTNELRD